MFLAFQRDHQTTSELSVVQYQIGYSVAHTHTYAHIPTTRMTDMCGIGQDAPCCKSSFSVFLEACHLHCIAWQRRVSISSPILVPRGSDLFSFFLLFFFRRQTLRSARFDTSTTICLSQVRGEKRGVWRLITDASTQTLLRFAFRGQEWTKPRGSRQGIVSRFLPRSPGHMDVLSLA